MSNWFDDRAYPELYYPGEHFPGDDKQGVNAPPGGSRGGGVGYFPGEFFCEEYFVPPYFGGSEWMLDHGIRPEDLVPHGVPEKKKKTRRGRKGKGKAAPQVAPVVVEHPPRVFGPWIDLDKRDEERRQQAAELTQQALERIKQKSDEELWLVMTIAALADETPQEDEEQVALEFMKALALIA